MKRTTSYRIKAEVFWAYARAGAFQRAKIYEKNIAKDEKGKFRNLVKRFLYEQIFLIYQKKKITESKLIDLIEALVKKCQGKQYLEKRRLQFGNAQKFVNLYLKSMWVTGFGKMPPHFPVDRIVVNELNLTYNWTDMSKTEYKVVIEEAKNKVEKMPEYKSIAIWEAVFYQEKYIDKYN